jgi:hypothetical protein
MRKAPALCKRHRHGSYNHKHTLAPLLMKQAHIVLFWATRIRTKQRSGQCGVGKGIDSWNRPSSVAQLQRKLEVVMCLIVKCKGRNLEDNTWESLWPWVCQRQTAPEAWSKKEEIDFYQNLKLVLWGHEETGKRSHGQEETPANPISEKQQV